MEMGYREPYIPPRMEEVVREYHVLSDIKLGHGSEVCPTPINDMSFTNAYQDYDHSTCLMLLSYSPKVCWSAVIADAILIH